MPPATVKKTILVLNGPNLNLLGAREPEIYGTDTLADILQNLRNCAAQHSAVITDFQSNHEGECIDRIHATMADGTDFILFNPGAFTHTSIAIRDALTAVKKPFIEIHLSNIFSREEFRHHSFLSDIALGVICGLGIKGYELALLSALHYQ